MKLLKLMAFTAFLILACAASIAPQAAASTAVAAALVAIPLAGWLFTRSLRQGVLCNAVTFEEVPLHCKSRTYTLDSAITQGTYAVLVKRGTDDNHVDVCGAADLPIGVIYNEGGAAAAAGDRATVHFLQGTIKLPATAAIAIGAQVFTVANGAAQPLPTASGTYYWFGRARTAAGASGDWIEINCITPVLVKGLALFGNTNSEIGGLTFSSTPTQAEANALRDKCEELADDLRALQAALNTPGLLLLGLAS